jgi:hypothetical protein
MKSESKPVDERDRFSFAVHALKQKLGPRVTAHLMVKQMNSDRFMDVMTVIIIICVVAVLLFGIWSVVT